MPSKKSMASLSPEQALEIERLKQFVLQPPKDDTQHLCIRSEVQEHVCPLSMEPIPAQYLTHVRSNNADYYYDVRYLTKALELDKYCRDPMTRSPYTAPEFRRIQEHARRAGVHVPSDAVLAAVRDVRESFSNLKLRAIYQGLHQLHEEIDTDLERIVKYLRGETAGSESIAEKDRVDNGFHEAQIVEAKWRRIVEERIFLSSFVH